MRITEMRKKMLANMNYSNRDDGLLIRHILSLNKFLFPLSSIAP